MIKRKVPTVPSTLEFGDVTFMNFPSFVNDGEVSGWPLLSGAVAESVAAMIPERLKEAVTIDWAKLDTDRLVEEFKEKHGVKSPFSSQEEAEAAEKRLLTVIFGANND